MTNWGIKQTKEEQDVKVRKCTKNNVKIDRVVKKAWLNSGGSAPGFLFTLRSYYQMW